MSDLSVTWPPPWEEFPATAGAESVLFDLPKPLRRYLVTVTLRREDDSRLPTEDQAVAELAVTALCAEGLIGAWSSGQSVLSLYLDAAGDAAALEAGAALVRAIGGTRGASVSAERADL